MRVSEFVAVVRRRWLVLVLLMGLGLGAGAFTAPDQSEPTVRYRATATVAVLTNRVQANFLALEPVSAEIAALVATVGEVPRRAAARLGYQGNPGELAAQVTAKTAAATQTLDLSVTSTDGPRAAEIANAFANETVAVLEERRATQVNLAIQAAKSDAVELQTKVNEIEADIASRKPPPTDRVFAERTVVTGQLNEAFTSLQALESLLGPGSSRLSVVSEAVPATAPASAGLSPPVAFAGRLAVAGIVGLLAGVAIALVIERADPHILSKEQAEEAYGIPVLAEVPYVQRGDRQDYAITMVDHPRSGAAEAYRNLRTALLFMDAGQASNGADPAAVDQGAEAHHRPKTQRKLILVTSPGPAEGKTTCVANLAACLAEGGMSVVVISGDVRKPSIHHFFGVKNSPGLSDIANRGLGLEGLFKASQKTPVNKVWLVAAGNGVSSPAALLIKMRDVIRAARTHADVVLVDTAPILLANDTRELLPIADGVLVVGRAGQTTVGAAKEASELLERLKAPTIGVVLIDTASMHLRRGRYYRYGPYHGYYGDIATNGDLSAQAGSSEHRSSTSGFEAAHSPGSNGRAAAPKPGQKRARRR